MRPHQTFSWVPAKRRWPIRPFRGPRPVRPPRVLASLARTPGRFRGSARRALRPFCKELAGLGQAEAATSQEARPGTGDGGHAASRKCRSGAPKGEPPDRKGGAAEAERRRRTITAPFGASLPSLFGELR